MSDHHGQWQADGDDLKTGKQCVLWGQDTVPTKEDGHRWLAEVSSKLTHGERKRREPRACNDAKKFIRRAPPEGYPSTMRRFHVDKDKPTGACIDLEIYGMAFCDV